MKFLATVLIALWSLPVFSFSLTEFAALENAGKPSGFIHWHGHGTMVNAPGGEKSPFLVSLTMHNLGNHLIRFQYNVHFAGEAVKHQHFLAQVEDNGFFTVYVAGKECDGVEPNAECAPAGDDCCHQSRSLQQKRLGLFGWPLDVF